MPDMPYAMTIAGKRAYSERRQTAINPATEEPICDFPLATRDQLESAVAAARQAFPAWSAAPQDVRSAGIEQLADLIEANYEGFVRLLITEQGKGRAGADWEIGGSVYWLREIARQRLPEEIVRDDADNLIVTRRTPIGVVGAITPWNFPVLLAVWKIAPALVTGNTVVLKPSPWTPLCTLWLGELAQQVLPAGVLNVLSGDNDLGSWMTTHPDIGKISFTGSTATGSKVMESSAGNLKRLTLELGGNDPAIVLPDVDPKALAKELFWTAFANSAQFCVACKRLYIHEDVYDDVARELVDYARTVKVGNGLEEGTELGPIQNRMQFEKVKALLADCKAQGQNFLLGGEAETNRGYFIPVTIIDNPPDDARCVTEEAFGPVLPLLKYRDINDVVRRANNTPYGLAASVWGKDLEQAESIARRIEAGTVWINQAHVFAPDIAFGGHKQSGVGIENSLHGLAEYTNSQTIMRKPLASA